MTRVLLGTDAGPGSERVATWTAELIRLLDGDLEVVEAYPRRSAEQSPEAHAELDASVADELAHWVSSQHLDNAARRTLQLEPEEALGVAAREWGADAVVIGSEDEEGLTSLGLGSIAHRLAHHVRCPLIVVPPGDSGLEGGTVVVGVNGSMIDTAALRWASGIAARIRGNVLAVFSVDARHDPSGQGDDSGPENPTTKRPGPRGFADVEYLERYGTDPASTLRDVAAERHAALIVVSAKQHQSLGGTLLGTVADHLLHHPTRPVAVVPHGFEASSPSSSAEA